MPGLAIGSCVCLLLLVCFYWPWLSGNASFYVLDFYHMWHPLLCFMGEQVRRGRLPLWDPYVLNGMPQTFFPSIFYLPNLLFAVTDFNQAFALVFILQQMAAFVGMFLLIESFGWGLWASLFAGLAFALSGMMFSLQTTYTMQGSLAWFPLTLWAVRGLGCGLTAGAGEGGACAAPAFRQRYGSRMPLLVVASASGALMILSGMTEVYAPCLAGLAAYALFLSPLNGLRKAAPAPPGPGGRRGNWWTLLSLVLALMLAAPALLPTAEWARLSPRSLGLSPLESFKLSANWYDLVCLVAWQPLGDFFNGANPFLPLLAKLYMPAGEEGSFSPFIVSTYLGAPVISAAIWGAFDRSFRWRIPLLAIVVAAGILAAGFHVPSLVRVAPLLHITSFRFPTKAVAFAVLPAIVLAARGVWLFGGGKRTVGLIASEALWVTLVLGAAAFGLALRLGPATGFGLTPTSLAAADFCGSGITGGAALGLCCCVLFHLSLRKPAYRSRLCALLALVSCTCLFINAWNFNRQSGSPDFYREPVSLAGTVSHLYSASGSGWRTPRIAMLTRMPQPTALMWFPSPDSSYRYKRQMLYPMTNVDQRIDSTFYTPNGQTADDYLLWQNAARRHELNDDVPLAVLCQVTATPFVEIQGPHKPPDPRLFQPAASDETLGVSIYRVGGVLPRAYLTRSVKWARPHEALVQAIANPQQSGFDPLRTTYLEHEQQGEVGPPLPALPASSSDRISVVEENPTHITLAVHARAASFLILADQFYPGWECTVDGKRVNMYRANVLCRAVFVPAGRHLVGFAYEPASVRLGLWAAAAAAAALLLLPVLASATVAARKDRPLYIL